MVKLVLKTSKPSDNMTWFGNGEMDEKLYAIELKDETINRLWEESRRKENCMTLTVVGLLCED